MYEVVVDIDFGLSRTGFAYSFFDKNKIMHGQIYISIDNKVLIEIILDDNNFIVQFGETCSQYLKKKDWKQIIILKI